MMLIVILLALILKLILNMPARVMRIGNYSIPIGNNDVYNRLDFFEHNLPLQ